MKNSYHVDGLVQDWSNSIANALELLQSCTRPSNWYWFCHVSLLISGARPTNDISIEFEIRPNFAVLCFKMFSTDHNEILHMSRQCNCRDVCKISL